MKSNINHSRNRLISASCLVLVIILAYALLFSPSSALAANRVVDDAEVKVFVGSSRSTSTVKANNYIKEREAYLDKLSSQNADSVYSAVVVLNDYYSAEEIEELAKKENISISKIYLWIPGETGRGATGVRDNDISGAITKHCKKVMEITESAKPYYERILNGNYGIFSIVIETTAAKLNELKGNGTIEFIDVKYSEEGEKAAADRGVNIQYIELPYKPDGAL